ncbi:hypothetical protein EC991_006642 [Linnemannia zychae]|nr:hypothetical protein EC991_006642 [Linnemannia zychae]
MSPPRPLPTEIFAVIFDNLERQDLRQCLFVSHLWHTHAESRLYSDITIDARDITRNQVLIPALKSRRHLLRRVEWLSDGQEDNVLEADLLDILLDHRTVAAAADTVAEDRTNGHNVASLQKRRSFSTFLFSMNLWKRRTWTTPPVIQDAELIQPYLSPTETTRSPSTGLNRPALKDFIFIGEDWRGLLQGSFLFNLLSTSLTTLELHLVNYGQGSLFCVELERILDTYPHLKTLCLVGSMLQYEPVGRVKDSGQLHSKYTTGPGPFVQHRLEEFTFAPSMMSRLGSEAFTFLERLENLRRIRVISERSYSDCAQGCRTWEFGRALKLHCPKLEFIDIDGPAIFWFFDLPALTHDQIRQITSLADQTPAYMLLVPEELAQTMREDRLRLQLLDQEQEELLESKSGEPLFPLLKTLILGRDHSLSLQDLFLLGGQAEFLTHLEFNAPPTQHTEPWEVYDRDAIAATATTIETHLSSATSARIRSLLENKLLQKRGPFNTRELIKFLQLCPRLRHLSLTGFDIALEVLIEGFFMMGAEVGLGGTSVIQPWACEDTLETLKISVDVLPRVHPDLDRAAWRHLGRFKKLRSLTVACTAGSRNRTFLFPTFEFGVEGLFQGGEAGKEGMSKTLEELQLMSNWWDAKEGRKMVLWLAKTCPRLKKLVLVYNFRFCEGGRRKMEEGGHDAFLEDEDVKQSSIPQIDIQTMFF